MKRYASPLVNKNEMTPILGRVPTTKTWRLGWNREQSSASMKIHDSYVSINYWPAGHTQPHGLPHQLEHHTLHEEIFVLDGAIHFDHWYSMTGLAYMNHPPFWVHPTNFWAGDDGLTMLLRISHDPIVQFEDIPENWDGVEYVATGKPSRCKGVTKLQIDDLPWGPVTRPDGSPLGYDGKAVWYDNDDGWLTWIMRVPAGWHGSGSLRTLEGSDEVFVLDGDLTLDRGDGPVQLSGGSYFCDPDRFVDGGAAERSENGCMLIRWTRGDIGLDIPGAAALTGNGIDRRLND